MIAIIDSELAVIRHIWVFIILYVEGKSNVPCCFLVPNNNNNNKKRQKKALFSLFEISWTEIPHYIYRKCFLCHVM